MYPQSCDAHGGVGSTVQETGRVAPVVMLGAPRGAYRRTNLGGREPGTRMLLRACLKQRRSAMTPLEKTYSYQFQNSSYC